MRAAPCRAWTARPARDGAVRPGPGGLSAGGSTAEPQAGPGPEAAGMCAHGAFTRKAPKKAPEPPDKEQAPD